MNGSKKDPSRSGRDLLCLNLCSDLTLPKDGQIRLFREAGFDGFFSGWGDDIVSLRETAEREGMFFQSVHAPFFGLDAIWRGDGAEEMTKSILDCVDGTADAGVDLMICHAYIGFEIRYPITERGIDCFRRIVDRAGKRGVRVAFENTEGEEYLAALMEEFAHADHVGFCFDSGHAMCYNAGTDMLALYGDRLIATHLNDNLGVSDPGGVITWRDDLHLLPFDGVADWEKTVRRLDAVGFEGPYTFELKKSSSRGRDGPAPYAALSDAEYVHRAAERARKAAEITV